MRAENLIAPDIVTYICTLQLDERGRDDPLYRVQNVALLTASHVKVWPLPVTHPTTVQADRVFDRHIRPG